MSIRSNLLLSSALVASALVAGMHLLSAGAAVAEPAYMGAGSCASSNCHGSVSPRKATNVLQNEYVTWQKHDLHSQAWLVLGNEDSRRIAAHLGIKDAQQEPMCLVCHSTYKPDARRSANFQLEDGVSCEACHGPAENYLGPHTATDATHAKNVELGMSDIVPVEARASMCIDCHTGAADRAVTHRLIGAGHPRLSFELDTYSMLEPKHWVVDDDYRERKGDYQPVQAWLVGQGVVADEMLAMLQSPERSRDGMWPELSLMYCYTCHHSLAEEQWKDRTYGGRPGELRLNTASLIILREALAALDEAGAVALRDGIEAMHNQFRDGIKPAVVQNVRATVKETSGRLSKRSFSEREMRTLLRRLSSFCAGTGALPYEVAEQVAMGMSSIQSALSADGSLFKREIDAVYAALKTPAEFRAADFTKSCGEFQARLR